MATETDVCASCSASFDDLKSAIKCNGCDKFFHGPCEGIPNLKGFHMRRATWKCQKCVQSDPQIADGGSSRKRHRSLNGDMVEMDRNELVFLMETVKILSETVAGMEKKMDVLYEQNKKLSSMVSTLLDKNESRPEKTSFAAITSKNSKRSTPTRKVNNPIAVVDVNTSDRQTAESKLEKMETNEEDVENFKSVKPRRNRPLKPFIIGSGESKSAGGENQPQLLGTEVRQWIYVGRVSVAATVDTVISHVKSTWNISDVKCFQLAKREELCSFKVGVHASSIPSLLDASKWPKHVAIREFVHYPRKNATGNRQNSGNFPTASQTDPPL